MLHYKKPAFRVVAVALVFYIAAAICLLTNPQSDPHVVRAENEQGDIYMDADQEGADDAIDSSSDLLHSENGREYGYPTHTYTK